eukprot:11200713-Lingulodinium_polyedra.AAC.1
MRFASRRGCGWSTRPRHCSVLQTLRNDAVESVVRRRTGTQIARSRTPCARQKTGARVECASVQLASRCSRG